MKIAIKKAFIYYIVILYTLMQVSTISASTIINNDSEELIIESESVVLMDATTGTILYQKNMNTRQFPASITKILTTLLVLENSKGDYEQEITFSKDAIFGIDRGSSHIAIDVDEKLSVNDALYGLLLASANEVAAGLAEYFGGSIDGFADMMNNRARDLGAVNSHFTNPHGLPNDNHYTTAYDMALIMKELVKHDKFNKVSSAPKYTILPTEFQPDEIPLYNSNKLFQQGTYNYPYTVGSKTGYTDIARHTLVSYAVKGDIKLIAVALKGEKNIPYSDTITLFEYGFNHFSKQLILSKSDFNETIEDNEKTISLGINEDIFGNVPLEFDKHKIILNKQIDKNIKDNISINDIVGKLDICYNDCVIESVDLIARNIVSNDTANNDLANDNPVFNDFNKKSTNNNFVSTILQVLLLLLLIFVILFLIVIYIRMSNKRKRKRLIQRGRHRRIY